MRKPDLTLPYPPSSNRYWRLAGSRLYVSAEALAYRKQVNAIVSLLPIDCQRSGDIGIRLHFYRPRCCGDLDNFSAEFDSRCNRINLTISAFTVRSFSPDSFFSSS